MASLNSDLKTALNKKCFATIFFIVAKKIAGKC